MEQTLSQPAPNPMRAVLSVRDFMLLWIGQAASMLGDQFHGIAAAWLVLKLSGDPLALGTVLALGGIPRAIFTLVGGAVSDRFSPRQVMLLTDLIRLLIAGCMAAQIFTNTLELWMIYAYTLVGGVVSGVFGPASMSIIPHILPEKDLQAGNSLTQGSTQLIGFIGPALAGALIAAFPNEQMGVGAAIAFDTLTFIVSLLTLWLMRTGGRAPETSAARPSESMLHSIRAGIRYIAQDPILRLVFIIIAIANLSIGGPIIVGVPFLADVRFPEGAAAYGLILSGYAGGNLLGVLLSGMMPKPGKKLLQVLLVALFGIFGLGIGALAWISTTWLATLDLLVMGILNGYISILFITGLQRNTPREMLGRLMSMLLFANMALIPLSQTVAGAMLRWNTPALFVSAATLLIGLTLYLALPGKSRTLSSSLIES